MFKVKHISTRVLASRDDWALVERCSLKKDGSYCFVMLTLHYALCTLYTCSTTSAARPAAWQWPTSPSYDI